MQLLPRTALPPLGGQAEGSGPGAVLSEDELPAASRFNLLGAGGRGWVDGVVCL